MYLSYLSILSIHLKYLCCYLSSYLSRYFSRYVSTSTTNTTILLPSATGKRIYIPCLGPQLCYMPAVVRSHRLTSNSATKRPKKTHAAPTEVFDWIPSSDDSKSNIGSTENARSHNDAPVMNSEYNRWLNVQEHKCDEKTNKVAHKATLTKTHTNNHNHKHRQTPTHSRSYNQVHL